jgi:hypothetical protein
MRVAIVKLNQTQCDMLVSGKPLTINLPKDAERSNPNRRQRRKVQQSNKGYDGKIYSAQAAISLWPWEAAMMVMTIRLFTNQVCVERYEHCMDLKTCGSEISFEGTRIETQYGERVLGSRCKVVTTLFYLVEETKEEVQDVQAI